MSLDKNSTVAELRTELERKRKRALDLQMNTTDMDEWKNLNAIRWELEDIDNDLYRSRFINRNSPAGAQGKNSGYVARTPQFAGRVGA